MSDDLWPEDMLTAAEWAAAWFDRQVIAGRRQEWERALVPRCFGGTRDEPFVGRV